MASKKKYMVDGVECSLWFVLERYKNTAERIEGLADVLLSMDYDFSLDNNITRGGLFEIFLLIRDKSEAIKDGLNIIFDDLCKNGKEIGD